MSDPGPDEQPRRRTPDFSDEEILAGLREAAAELGEPLSSDRYDIYCQAHRLVSSVRIIQRFGTWNGACSSAGLATRRSRQNYTRRWTEEEMAAYVAQYLGSQGASGSYSGYAEWAKGVDGAPSGQSVRNAFGGWADAKDVASRLPRDA